jgi:hypothetical protein
VDADQLDAGTLDDEPDELDAPVDVDEEPVSDEDPDPLLLDEEEPADSFEPDDSEEDAPDFSAPSLLLPLPLLPLLEARLSVR